MYHVEFAPCRFLVNNTPFNQQSGYSRSEKPAYGDKGTVSHSKRYGKANQRSLRTQLSGQVVVVVTSIMSRYKFAFMNSASLPMTLAGVSPQLSFQAGTRQVFRTLVVPQTIRTVSSQVASMTLIS